MKSHFGSFILTISKEQKNTLHFIENNKKGVHALENHYIGQKVFYFTLKTEDVPLCTRMPTINGWYNGFTNQSHMKRMQHM